MADGRQTYIREGEEIRVDYDGGSDERVFYERMLREGIAAESLLDASFAEVRWWEPQAAKGQRQGLRRRTNTSALNAFERELSSDDGEY